MLTMSIKSALHPAVLKNFPYVKRSVMATLLFLFFPECGSCRPEQAERLHAPYWMGHCQTCGVGGLYLVPYWSQVISSAIGPFGCRLTPSMRRPVRVKYVFLSFLSCKD